VKPLDIGIRKKKKKETENVKQGLVRSTKTDSCMLGIMKHCHGIEKRGLEVL
jgi:hypothetical protein